MADKNKLTANEIAMLTLTTLKLIDFLASKGVAVTTDNLEDQIAKAEKDIADINSEIFSDKQ